MDGLGKLTMVCIAAGLLAFIVFALWPGHGPLAILLTLYTPLAAAAITGIQLLLRKRTSAGICLLAALALIVAALVSGVKL